jgi:hypothetical protein
MEQEEGDVKKRNITSTDIWVSRTCRERKHFEWGGRWAALQRNIVNLVFGANIAAF